MMDMEEAPETLPPVMASDNTPAYPMIPSRSPSANSHIVQEAQSFHGTSSQPHPAVVNPVDPPLTGQHFPPDMMVPFQTPQPFYGPNMWAFNQLQRGAMAPTHMLPQAATSPEPLLGDLLRDMSSCIRVVDTDLAQTREEGQVLRSNNTQLQKECFDLKIEIAHLEHELKDISSHRDYLRRKSDDLERQVDALSDEVKLLEDSRPRKLPQRGHPVPPTFPSSIAPVKIEGTNISRHAHVASPPVAAKPTAEAVNR